MDSSVLHKSDFEQQFHEDTSELLLDPKHPGINDSQYCQRRSEFFELGRRWRLEKRGVPRVEYHEQEQELWAPLSQRLREKHEQKASHVYLAGREALEIEGHRIPQLADLSDKLKRVSGFAITAAEGLLNFREFFGLIADGHMPCTQYLRHHSQPEYTPEPDMVHDVIGHVPVLANEEYVRFIRLIGEISRQADEELLEKLSRLYWFTIEFGLIEERSELRVLGAGILSSAGEMDFCFSREVDRRRFSVAEITELDYDPTEMQRTLFIVPSLEQLLRETRELAQQSGIVLN